MKTYFFFSLSLLGLQGALHLNDTIVPQPHLLHLSAERLSRDGAFLMDCGNVSVQDYSSIMHSDVKPLMLFFNVYFTSFAHLLPLIYQVIILIKLNVDFFLSKTTSAAVLKPSFRFHLCRFLTIDRK